MSSESTLLDYDSQVFALQCNTVLEEESVELFRPRYRGQNNYLTIVVTNNAVSNLVIDKHCRISLSHDKH